MGRTMPSGDDHPALSFSLAVAGIAAIMAVITNLCGFRKKTSQIPSSTPEVEITWKANADRLTTAGSLTAREREEETANPLPPPPAMRELRETHSFNNYMTKAESKRGGSSTMSVKIPKSMSLDRQRDEVVRKAGKKAKVKTEDDSVWTKTIILGEKCRIRDDEDDVIYENRDVIANANANASSSKPITKTMSALPLSRTSSLMDHNVFPNKQKQKKKILDI